MRPSPMRRTWNTLPNAPCPTTQRTSKSSGPTGLFGSIRSVVLGGDDDVVGAGTSSSASATSSSVLATAGAAASSSTSTAVRCASTAPPASLRSSSSTLAASPRAGDDGAGAGASPGAPLRASVSELPLVDSGGVCIDDGPTRLCSAAASVMLFVLMSMGLESPYGRYGCAELVLLDGVVGCDPDPRSDSPANAVCTGLPNPWFGVDVPSLDPVSDDDDDACEYARASRACPPPNPPSSSNSNCTRESSLTSKLLLLGLALALLLRSQVGTKGTADGFIPPRNPNPERTNERYQLNSTP
mmetsp:Transcript_13045/g.29739  ORF Transcript_13045/g.29739 Transcript_13045/m.29739 type:complete len:299 (-) Transcript_13045:104-1000(-)